MKILFLGSVIKTENCTEFLGPSVAGNKMQLGILKGLNKIHKDLTVVSEIPIATFPKEKKILIRTGYIEIADNMRAKIVPFINLLVLKQITMITSATFMLFQWGLKNLQEEKSIITFNPFPYVSIPAILFSKIFKSKIVCIFADPPIDPIKRNLFFRYAKYFENKSAERRIKQYDCIVTLNKKAVEKYAPNTKYVLVDGGFDLNDIPFSKVGGQWLKYSQGDIIDIIFSGGLYEYNGIVNLINAFKTINNDRLRLSVYGEGPLKEFVVKSVSEDSRVVYCGNVSNHEMLKIQQEAGILINPRPINEPISLYTFPSKLIEYMLSGTPVITTKLNGLTPEYLSKVFAFEGDTAEAIAKGIEYVISLDKVVLIDKAFVAREFMIKNKNWEIQSEKIFNFIKDSD